MITEPIQRKIHIDKLVIRKMYSLDDIIEFIKEKTAAKKLSVNDDLFNDLDCSGDDHHELMEDYSKKFNVDMSTYFWYFHADEEGQNFGSIFFKPPYTRVEHIPVTPQTLLEFANKGKWDIKYPKHTLPKRRYDILINKVIVGILLAYLVYWVFKKVVM